jgi:hypothetical protein
VGGTVRIVADGWAILESLSTLGGTIVLAGGAVAAALYGRKANPSIDASVHSRPEVGAGETVAKTELFHLPAFTSNLVGWQVNFFVDIPKFLTFHRRWWTWAADTFINVPDPA